MLLDSLRKAGAREQAAALAERAATHAPLDDPYSVAMLLDSLRKAGAGEQAAALAARLPAAGMFGLFLEQHGRADEFRFGREPGGTPATPWDWDDLDLRPGPQPRRSRKASAAPARMPVGKYTIADFMETFSAGRAAVCPAGGPYLLGEEPRAGNHARSGRATRACRQLLPGSDMMLSPSIRY
jgi:hypothetical protein